MRRSGRGARGLGMLGALLILGAFLVLGGLSAAALMLRPPPTDPDTLCRTDAPLNAHTIVLVDSTDRFEPRHRRKLRAVLAQERGRLSQYDRLSVMRVNVRRAQEPTLLFSRCLPRPPEQTNPLFENARMAQARWDEDFESLLAGAARSAQSGGPARASPLVASLRAAAADPEFGPEIPHRRLVLVSDLLEHDPNGFSLYVADVDYSAWRLISPAGPPDLSGVAVRVAPLDRPESLARQAAAISRFWRDFFDASAAESVSIDASP